MYCDFKLTLQYQILKHYDTYKRITQRKEPNTKRIC